ncbi:MAG: SAM-dependent chlorinase/fluorinase [Deltaproteobacteria bacterium]|nr:SAM-dependent chlorinase/fluorinase [Deltaproteobacteria bacterium]
MPSTSGLITFTSDFGSGWYAGAMRGAALAVNPRATLVDITHAVSPQNILEGAFALAAGCEAFPDGAVHVAVIDPGVGTARSALVIETARAFFVGPDNGVLTLAAPPAARRAARLLENPRYFRNSPSATFHGRDLFAPVAAHLSLGADPVDFGSPAGAIEELALPPALRDGDGWVGEVLLADCFGNLITNLPGGLLAGPAGSWEAWLGERPLGPLRRTYGDTQPGEALALVGSHGYVEIAVSGDSAARCLGEGSVRPQVRGLAMRLRMRNA